MFALLLFVVAIVLFIPVLREYILTGLVPRFPTLIGCGFLMISGLLAGFAGMILDNTVAKDRRDFEYRLNQVNAEKKKNL